MRRNKTQTIEEVINDLIQEYRIGEKLKETAVINQWHDVTGKAIASRTSRIYIRSGVLHIYLNSSVVKNELMMLREALRDQLNKKVGAEVIREIVLH